MKIFLIGMPGSGKSTLGKQLAERLFSSFVDLDAEIEKAEGKPISEIFSSAGQDYFRLTESRLLHEWAARSQSFVMSTGGGAPCFYNGIGVINQSGLSVFLDCPVNVLINRVKNNQVRPLLQSNDRKETLRKLEAMRRERLSCYRKAQIILKHPTLETLLNSINRPGIKM